MSDFQNPPTILNNIGNVQEIVELGIYLSIRGQYLIFKSIFNSLFSNIILEIFLEIYLF